MAFVDSPSKIPQAALCGVVMGASLAPTAVVERVVAARASSGPTRALLAFGCALLVALAVGLFTDLQIAYTAAYERSHSMEAALIEVHRVLEGVRRSPSHLAELVAPIAVAMATLTAMRVATRRLPAQLLVTSIVAVTYMSACFVLPSGWRLDDRRNFAGFAVIAAMLAPLVLAFADWLTAVREEAEPVRDDEQRAPLVEDHRLPDPD